MKLINKCNGCKHLEKRLCVFDNYYYRCVEIYGFIYVDGKNNDGDIVIDNPNNFGCIAWEAEDEAN